MFQPVLPSLAPEWVIRVDLAFDTGLLSPISDLLGLRRIRAM
jgi:hypothetical protein